MASESVQSRHRKAYLKYVRLTGRFVVTAVFWGIGIIMVFPFLWMLSSSFKDTFTMFNYPIEWIPKVWNFNNYEKVWLKNVNFALYYWNSIKVTFFGLLGTLISCTAAGYAYSKIKFKGRNALFFMKLMTTMIPAQATILPTYVIYSTLRLTNTHTALWLTYALGGAFGVFLMRQNFMSMPTELIDAAKIDGANHPGILVRIAAPLSKPSIATLMFIYFIWIWNDYEKPLYFIRTRDMYTLQLATKLFQDDQFQDYAAIMAASVSVVAPIIILFFLAQKYFIQSVTSAGIKG